ncbi:MAG: hypothetical protein ACI9AD_000091 [Nitriliruptoraceae bacterium]
MTESDTGPSGRGYRRAILVVHGMGEQRPLDTLDRLAHAVLSEYDEDHRQYLSRPTLIGDSYEARRYIIPGIYDDPVHARPQTDLFEYHWSPLMTGNRLDDLIGTLRRILLQWPWRVPAGIRALWLVMWALIVTVAIILVRRAAEGGISATDVVTVIAGTGILGTIVSFAVTRLLPRPLTGSFVDVVRYLDPSPRSHVVRRDIRRGAVAMLRELNDEYDRVIVVAHSLGSYIAYDAIRQLWGERDDDYAGDPPPSDGMPVVADGLDQAEAASIPLRGDGSPPSDDDLDAFRSAQRQLSAGLRDDGHTWRISDLVTLGSPMYFADQLYTRDRAGFDRKVTHHEFPTCPPVDDYPSWQQRAGAATEPDRARRWTYVRGGRRVLYDAAPFAVVRWTNMWFPARLYVFGDFFGGALAPLFGRGIKDVRITSGGPRRLVPGAAHSFYFELIRDEPNEQLARAFHEALRL